MALEEVEFDLGWEGRRCRIAQLNAKDSRAVIAKLMNIVGTALREMGSASMDAVAEIVIAGSTMQRMDAATLDWLTETFAKVTHIESEAGTDTWLHPGQVIDLCFGGGEGTARWLRWLTFCLEHSCADFFAAALAESKRMQAKVAAGMPSPSTSAKNGFSTASRSAAATRIA